MNPTVHEVTYLLDRASIKKGEMIVLQKIAEKTGTMEQDFYQMLFYLFDYFEATDH